MSPTDGFREVLPTKAAADYGAAEAQDLTSSSMNAMNEQSCRTPSGEALGRVLFDTSSDGIVILDDAGTVLAANPAARAMSWSALEPLLIDASDDAELSAFRRRLVEGGEAATEIALPTEAGVRYVSLRGTVRGGVRVLHLRDVSERRAMELSIREARRLQTLGHFTAALAHDFNNILTPIVCLSALLKERLDPESPLARLPSELEALARSGAALARQALAFTRGESTPPQPIDINTVVREMQVLIERLVGGGVAVDAWLDGALGQTMVDRVQLEHVLLNLIANARDAMPRGGRLRLRTANVFVSEEGKDGAPQTLATGKYVMLSVTDDGVGMSPEVRQRAFDRYFTTKASSGGGHGIGLANAHQFATESGGAITVRSELGEGTSIALYLPRHDPGKIPTVPPPPSRGRIAIRSGDER